MVNSTVVMGWTGGPSSFIGEVTVRDKSRGGVSASNFLQLVNTSITADSTGLTTLLFTRPLRSAADFATVHVNGTGRSTIVWAKGENVPRDLSDVDGHSHENHGITSFSFVTDNMIDPGSGSGSGGVPHCDHDSTGSSEQPSGRLVPFRDSSRYMEACSELSFSFVLCWNFLDDGLNIQMSLQAVPTESGGYLAIGFGEQMIGSPAIIGAVGANGDRLLSTYDLVSYTSGTARPGSTKLSISDTDISADRQTSVVTMVFTRPLLLPLYSMGSIVINQASATPIIFAQGDAPSDARSINYHVHRNRGSVNFVTGLYSATEPINLDGQSRGKLILVHGICMVAAWIFLMPIGIIIARYCRRRGYALWFHLHRAFVITGLVVALSGWILALAKLGTGTYILHRGLGIYIMSAALFQPVNALVRPAASAAGEKVSTARSCWNAVHHWNARTALVLAFVNICVGLSISGAANSYWILIPLAWIAALLACAWLQYRHWRDEYSLPVPEQHVGVQSSMRFTDERKEPLLITLPPSRSI